MSGARVVVVGLGPIGREMARGLVGRKQAAVVAAADPAHAGADLGELIGTGKSGIIVSASAKEAYARGGGNVALLCTTSRLDSIVPQIEEAALAKHAVVSTCEELSYPAHRSRDVAAHIDDIARKEGVVVLGVGVNPGFVMDRLPLALAATCVKVERVFVRRVVDAAKRREPLRAKVGAGVTPDEFTVGVKAGKFGHVGIGESVRLLGAGLGMQLDDVRETIEPVIATKERPREGVAPGRVAGVHQTAQGIVRGEPRISLDLEMSMGAPDPHDHVRLEADPPLDVRLAGGTQGDRGTIGAALNAIPHVLAGPPGLRTVAELPLFGVLR